MMDCEKVFLSSGLLVSDTWRCFKRGRPGQCWVFYRFSYPVGYLYKIRGVVSSGEDPDNAGYFTCYVPMVGF